MLSSRHPAVGTDGREEIRKAKANKIYVETTYSQDGRTLDGFWLSYNPDDTAAVYLLTRTLNGSDAVKFYWVFDSEGIRKERPKPLYEGDYSKQGLGGLAAESRSGNSG